MIKLTKDSAARVSNAIAARVRRAMGVRVVLPLHGTLEVAPNGACLSYTVDVRVPETGEHYRVTMTDNRLAVEPVTPVRSA